MSFLHTSILPMEMAPLAQSSAFGAALTAIGRGPKQLALRAEGPPLQVLCRRFGPLHVGMVSRADLTRPQVHQVCRDAGVGALLLNANTDKGAHGVMLQTPGHVAELSLQGSEDEMRAAMHQKWRNRLAKAERQRIKIIETGLKPSQGHWVFAKESAQARARGYKNWPEGLTRAYAKANPAQARVFEARVGGDTLAVMVFLRHGAVATYHIGWTSEEGRGYCLHHAIFWQAMLRFRSRGCQRLDLGMVATDAAPGLARFKLGSGAQLRTLGGTWLAVPWLLSKRRRAQHASFT